MATLDSYYAAVNSLGNYVNSTSVDCVTTTATTGLSNQWYGLGQLGSGFVGGGLLNNQLITDQLQMQLQGVAYQQQYDVPKPKKTFSRVLDALRSEIKEWCGDALVMA